MKQVNSVLLMSDALAVKTQAIAKDKGIDLNAVVVSDLEGLEKAVSSYQNLLLSFGTSVIVPGHILEIPGLLSLNLHAASPQYPGRDPHHFAIYDGVSQYGATMHFMTKHVDAGLIVDIELFYIKDDTTPAGLLEQANLACFVLLERFFQRLKESSNPMPLKGVSWGERKLTRSMFIELCKVESSISKAEFSRRLKATTVPGYKNLYIELHGYKFRIEGPV